jgi:hypothetical protein
MSLLHWILDNPLPAALLLLVLGWMGWPLWKRARDRVKGWR